MNLLGLFANNKPEQSKPTTEKIVIKAPSKPVIKATRATKDTKCTTPAEDSILAE